MKDLPKIYQNPIDVHNNKETFYSGYEKSVLNPKKEKKDLPMKTESVEATLAKIFKNKAYSYTKQVLVKTKNREFKTRLISRNQNQILTIDNEIIIDSEIEYLQILNQ